MVDDCDGLRRETNHSSWHFDTGLREQLDEDTIWHGMGWVTPDATVRLPIDPEHYVIIYPDGKTRFYDAK